MQNKSDDKQNTIENKILKSMASLSQYVCSLDELQTLKPLPPLHQWQPQRHGEMDLTIKANGEWWHEGAKMTRKSLVTLFARILWREDDEQGSHYYLKTPVEQLKITVEDVPLLITEVHISEQDGLSWLLFTTSTGDLVRLDAEHVPFLNLYQGELRPYMPVRDGLVALIDRPVYYHLLQIGQLLEEAEQVVLQLCSGGQLYRLQEHTDT